MKMNSVLILACTLVATASAFLPKDGKMIPWKFELTKSVVIQHYLNLRLECLSSTAFY